MGYLVRDCLKLKGKKGDTGWQQNEKKKKKGGGSLLESEFEERVIVANHFRHPLHLILKMMECTNSGSKVLGFWPQARLIILNQLATLLKELVKTYADWLNENLIVQCNIIDKCWILSTVKLLWDTQLRRYLDVIKVVNYTGIGGEVGANYVRSKGHSKIYRSRWAARLFNCLFVLQSDVFWAKILKKLCGFELKFGLSYSFWGKFFSNEGW